MSKDETHIPQKDYRGPCGNDQLREQCNGCDMTVVNICDIDDGFRNLRTQLVLYKMSTPWVKDPASIDES